MMPTTRVALSTDPKWEEPGWMGYAQRRYQNPLGLENQLASER